jgi:hypothetical protein
MSSRYNFSGQAESGSDKSIPFFNPGKAMIEQWLNCDIFKGMFSDELAIKYLPLGSTNPVSVFVPKDMVRGELSEGRGRVLVTVFVRGEYKWAVLPSSQRMEIPVKDSDLVSV